MDIKTLLFIFCIFGCKFANAELRDFRKFDCQLKVQPSAEEFLQEYAPHLSLHAIDLDFIVKEYSLCTSMLLALIQHQSGIVFSHRDWRIQGKQPFGQLSKQSGFLKQLIDIAQQIRKAQSEVVGDWIPASQQLAFLFDKSFPPGTPPRKLQGIKAIEFRNTYRQMFMQEYYPIQPQLPNKGQLHAWGRAKVMGWNFIRRYSSAVYH